MARVCFLCMALLALLPVGPAAATTLVVSTTDDLVNGDTSCPTALLANPGSDGISLREAILAVNNGPSCGDTGPDTITFDPSLAGQTIMPATLQYNVTQANVSIVGLTDANGQPTVTIDASNMGVNNQQLFIVDATGFALTSLRVLNLQTAQGSAFGVQLMAGEVFGMPGTQTIQNVSITNNQFINAPNLNVPDGTGTALYMGMQPTASGATLSNVTISGNTIEHFQSNTDGILISASGVGNTIEDVSVINNTFSDMTFEFGSGQFAQNNQLLHTRIEQNTFTGNVLAFVAQHLGDDSMLPSSGNLIDDTVIANNVFVANRGPAISLLGGLTNTTGNTISNTLIVNNLITGDTTYGPVGVVGGRAGTTQNNVSGVNIVNNTLTNYSGSSSNGGAVAVAANLEGSSGNTVSNISVSNTILWNNTLDFSGPTPSQVSYSITAQSGFYGVNSNIDADPLFVNPGSGDFHIGTGSPAIGAGTSTGAPAQDLDCVARPNPPSIGAYEPGETNNCTVPSQLTVTEPRPGSGQVISSPPGINCTATSTQCAASFAAGRQITLTASAGPNSNFSGWSGTGCAGTAPCTLTLTGNPTVAANFSLDGYPLSIAETGTGSGTVTSTPSGINCGGTCSASFQSGTQVALSATAANGSTFAGWSGGGCSGIKPCTVTVSAATSVSATFVADTIGNLTLVAAVLPLSRSVEIGNTATAFATIIDAGPDNASTCTIAPANPLPVSFLFQTTDPTTNALTGTANTPINIGAGQFQTFVIALTPSAASSPTNFAFTFNCANAQNPAASTVGIDMLELSVSTTPVPDIVALAASSDPGYVDIPGPTGTGVFAVATVNLGVDATIKAAANIGTANLPVTLLVCQTDPTSGACMAPPAPSATTDIQPNATPTFGIFVVGSATVANMPGVNRVFVAFTDSNGVLRGETSVAVRTQ
jgi:hypothetical protein